MESQQWLSREYHELNGSHIEVLQRPPSALQFAQLVHISRPVLIRSEHNELKYRWTDEYLIDRMGSRKISIAVTPNGLADAVTRGSDDKLYFAEPFVEQMTMAEFLSKLTSDSTHSEIYYLQSQNGNIYSSRYFKEDSLDSPSEFEPLRPDVPKDITWCTEAFGELPDAVNLWIGNSKSVTSIHCDPYENIYTVVRGAKHFTLLPPTEGWCLKERKYPHAVYTRPSPASGLKLVPSSPRFVDSVRWSSISDPHIPGALSPEAHPIHVTLRPGDILYLPVGWWHHVRQSGDITIALNWWYDAQMRGMSWVLLSFLRDIGNVPTAEED